MNKRDGFTLVEVQMAALMVVVVLITTGVIFYFALASVRYVRDAYEVYFNAHMAMKVIRAEVIRSNRYGWDQGNPAWVDGHPWDNEPYNQVTGVDATCWSDKLPTLTLAGNVNGPESAIFLRQEEPAIAGVGGGNPADYEDDAMLVIFQSANNEVRRNYDASGSNPLGTAVGDGDLVATNVTLLEFRKIAFNCVGVRLRVEGDIASPLGGTYNVVELNTMLTLHCAAAQTSEPWGSANPNDNIW
ncbi:MAG: hypothetical protein GY853_02755 [PVC group bacterium]|nr:hypothetical protein [PVC group bacterium]